MVNFRFHVVSLVAVLFALSIGVLLGVSSEIDDATVKRLDEAQRRLGKRNESLRDRVEELDGRLSGYEQYSERSRDIVVRGALEGKRVILLSFQSTDADDVLEPMETVLVRAGAVIESSIRLADQLDLATDARRKQAALALEVSETTGANELHAALVRSLVEALSGAKPGFVSRLIEVEFAEQRQLPGSENKAAADLTQKGILVVILAPNRDERKEFEQGFVAPLAESLVATGVITAVGETGTKDFELLARLREQGDGNVVTVDSIETPVGQTAMVLGLQAGMAGTFGHYGFAENASSVLPESPGSP